MGWFGFESGEEKRARKRDEEWEEKNKKQEYCRNHGHSWHSSGGVTYGHYEGDETQLFKCSYCGTYITRWPGWNGK